MNSVLHAKEKGVALVEWVVSLPILLMLGLGCVQWALIWEAKTALNYAALLAARAGAVSSLDINKMNAALEKGLFPVDRAIPARSLVGLHNYHIRILNPTKEAFMDFGEQATSEPPCLKSDIATNQCEIPNDRLERRKLKVGRLSDVSIQDANLLKIDVLYAFKLRVPYIGPLLHKLVLKKVPKLSVGWALIQSTRLDDLDSPYAILLSATSTVRMQSPAHYSSRVLDRKQVEKRAKGLIL